MPCFARALTQYIVLAMSKSKVYKRGYKGVLRQPLCISAIILGSITLWRAEV